MDKKSAKLSFCLLPVAVLLFAGCSSDNSDFHTEVGDTRGVTLQSPVVHYDVVVGRVGKVTAAETGFRLDVMLDKPFRNTLRADASACPSPAGLVMDEAALEIVGGNDASLPLLKKGTLIPEAQPRTKFNSVVDWALGSPDARNLLYLCGAFVMLLSALVGLFKKLPKIVRLVLFAVLLVALVYGGIGLKNGWSLEQIKSASYEDVQVKVEKLQKFLEGQTNLLETININLQNFTND